MSQRAVSASFPTERNPWRLARRVRANLAPPGETFLILAVTILLGAALSAILLRPPTLDPWHLWAALITLAAFLPQCYRLANFDAKVASPGLALRSIAINSLLFLGVGAFLPLPALTFLIFMLTTQAASVLPFIPSAAYTLGLALAWLLVLRLGGVPPTDLSEIVAHNTLGLVFSLVSGTVIGRYIEQKVRADALLRDLAAANTELATVRDREKDLIVAEERVRLARDIHDGLGHHLMVLNVQLQGAAKQLARDPERAATTIATCQEEAAAALGEVRRSVSIMRPSLLEGRPLNDALATLVEDFGRNTGCLTEFVRRGDTPIDAPAMALTLYRAAQEGLTNAYKHARACRVRVTLETATVARLTVWNDTASSAGVPTNVDRDVAPSSGFGLLGLAERAGQLGGDCIAGPQPDGSFALVVTIPLTLATPGQGRSGARW